MDEFNNKIIDNRQENYENTESKSESINFPEIQNFVSKNLDNSGNKRNILSEDKAFDENNLLTNEFEKVLENSNIRDKLNIKSELSKWDGNDKEELKVILIQLVGWGYNISDGSYVFNEVEQNNKDEDINQNRNNNDEANINNDEANINNDEADNNNEEADIEKLINERRKALRKAAEAYEPLAQNNPELNNISQEGSEKFVNAEKEFQNNGIINQLKSSGLNEPEIKQYISLSVVLKEITTNNQYHSLRESQDFSLFYKAMRNFENQCNIPDTNLSSFSTENIAQTRTELFDKDIGNETLIQAKNNNVESHAEAYAEIFPEMGTDEVIAKYGKFLQGDLKTFWQQYESNRDAIKNKIAEIGIMIKNQQIFGENGKKYISDEEKLLFDNYKKMISVTSEIKKDIENNTKNLMEEMCLISQIKGMSMCIGQEEGEDFNLNKAKEIEVDNGVLTLKGHIDGVDFSVRHDTDTPDSHLQTDSKLGISADKNTFMIGSEGQYVDSPFILPSQNEIFGVISEVVKSNDIKNSDSWDSYSKNLQKTIIGKVDEVYKDAEFAHHYITNKVKGEKILDSSLSLIQGIKPDIDLTKPINQASNEKLHSLLKIINFNIENSTTEEKNKLNQCITKIQDIKNTYRNNSGNEGKLSVAYPPIIEHYLKNEAWLNDGDEESKLGLVVDLLSYYNQNSKDTRANLEGSDGAPSKMIIEDLYRDLFEFQSSQSLIATTRKNEETEKQDKEEADVSLHLEDDSIWPPVESPVEYA